MSAEKRGGMPGFMVVAVGDIEVGLPIGSVGEVVATPPLARVPLAPRAVAGVTSIRGTVVPVLDLGLRLGAGSASREGRTVLVSATDGEDVVGVLVDRVSGLVDTDTPRTTGGTAGVPADLVDVVLRLEDGSMLAVLAIDALLAVPIDV